jgi:hypothetical protein
MPSLEVPSGICPATRVASTHDDVAEYQQKLNEVDRLLNDPDAPLDAAKVWVLLSEIAQHRDEFSNESAREVKR